MNRTALCLVVMAIVAIGLSSCARYEKDLRYLDSRMAAELKVPAGLDPVSVQPGYQLPADMVLDKEGRVVGAGDQQHQDIERPPQVLDESG